MSNTGENNHFRGRVALVTGATSGIGKNTALDFARGGAKLVIAGRRQAKGEQVAKEIAALGAEVLFVQTDIADEAQIINLVQKTVDHFGRLDIAFNNAGVEGNIAPTTEQTAQNYHHVFDINVMGVLLSMKHQIPAMMASGGGAIVNMASIAGLIGMTGGTVYFASKHAVLGLTKCAALENTQQNIRINAVCPGGIDTDLIDRFTGHDAAAKADFGSAHPLGRLGVTQEVSDAVLFLASDQASFITGQHLTVDGGFTAQ